MDRSASARARARFASVTRASAARRASRARWSAARQFRQPRLQRLMRLTRAIGPGRHLLQIALQLHQPVQLLQPQRRGRGSILGPRAEPVPAPEVALDG